MGGRKQLALPYYVGHISEGNLSLWGGSCNLNANFQRCGISQTFLGSPF